MTGSMSSYDDAPRIVIWEMTRACALACVHCRAEAIPRRDPRELTTAEACALVDDVVACGDPIFVLTGGDPFMRDDLDVIVRYASERGLRVAVSPSATGRLTAKALRRLKAAGCSRISLSLDGPDDASHDAFRGVRGSFTRTLKGIGEAREAGLEVQINTTVSRRNHRRIDEMARLVRACDVALWSVFFLVPVGRAAATDVLTATETEEVFADLYRLSHELPFPLKTTEAPHYRRYLAQRSAAAPRGGMRYAGIGDGKGFVFVSHLGEIMPSGFLPYVVGNVRHEPLVDVYRDHPIMRRLRSPNSFGGKCGVCEYHDLCGGSRARAYTMTGDAFASEPTCAYIPAAARPAHA